VLWRPGLTLWLAAWGNDKNETQAERLAWIKDAASPARSDVRESVRGGVTRLATGCATKMRMGRSSRSTRT